MVISGSVNIIAVASTVLGIKNPEVGRSEEYTLNTTAPSSPADSKVTSAATVGTLRNYKKVYYLLEIKQRPNTIKSSRPYNKILTDKAPVGVTPPPVVTEPGCGAPCGGNILSRGGTKAAAAATAARAKSNNK